MNVKILDLFAGTQSVKKALNNYNIDYKGVDIKGDNIILDLSQNNIIKRLKSKLGNWKPDFIWASPICYPFSRAQCITNGTLSFEIANKKIFMRKNFEQITHSQYQKFKNDLKWQHKQWCFKRSFGIANITQYSWNYKIF